MRRTTKSRRSRLGPCLVGRLRMILLLLRTIPWLDAPTPAPDEVLDGEMPEPSGGGDVSISVSPVTKPGMMASGSVTFSDGVTCDWYLDQFGRPGLVPPAEISSAGGRHAGVWAEITGGAAGRLLGRSPIFWIFCGPSPRPWLPSFPFPFSWR